jgi:inositol oxygenase
MENPTINLRRYEVDTPQYFFYKTMHEYQTFKTVSDKLKHYKSSYNACYYMNEVLEMMDDFIDPSDPDVDEPNSFHAYQTAESIRKREPNNKSLQVCGLIHDLGKILFTFGEPSWLVVGDTYAVGCKFPETIVYYETMKENPDHTNPLYNTKYGVYEPNCGIRNLFITAGHDEYLYQVLQNNKNHIFPIKYQDIIRFHSFYPWHTGGSYREFMKPEDELLLNDVRNFNQYDLYSKEDDKFILTDDIKKYYNDLLTEFFPEPLIW